MSKKVTHQKQLIIAARSLDETMKEIAVDLNLDETTVRNILHRPEIEKFTAKLRNAREQGILLAMKEKAYNSLRDNQEEE